MRVRVLLVMLFLLAFTLIFAFVIFVAKAVWDQLGLFLPQSILIGSAVIPTNRMLGEVSVVVTVFILLVLTFLYLIIDRLIIRPIKAISYALDFFAEHSARTELPKFSRTTYEISALADAFQRFTDNVEEVHKRDMEISRVKSDFISTAAHQLRTPLTGVRWALEALQLENLTEGQKALVKNAVDKSHDLVTIVGTLLDISSIESGKYKYVFGPVEVDTLVSDVVADFSMLAQESSVNLFYAKSGEKVPPVKADRDRIKWVLNNLVENAIRYTPAQGSVQLTVEVSGDRVFIRVSDTGIGIPASDRNNIFERFFRAGNAIAKENKGNGLGLYIARQIALDHGGDLSFKGNEASTGTTFTLALNIAK